MRLYKFINETTKSQIDVVRKDLNYLYKDIEKSINNYTKHKKINTFVKDLNSILNRKHIYVEIEKGVDDDEFISKAFVNQKDLDIIIWINSLVDPEFFDFSDFKRELDIKLSHEYIHRKQYFKLMKNKYIPKSNLTPDSSEKFNIKRYLSDHQEIEAWANQIYLYILEFENPSLFYDILNYIYDDVYFLNKYMKKIYFYAKDNKKVLNLINKYLKEYKTEKN